MTAFGRDTSPEAEREMTRLLRAASPGRKMALLAGLNRTARQAAMAGLRIRHPDENEEVLRQRLAALLYGPDLAARAYGRPGEERRSK